MTKDIIFYEKWVNPFYPKLMNWNFMRMSSEDTEEFVEHITDTLSEIDETIIRQMLHSQNWRPRLTAGWFIGFKKMSYLTDEVATNLMRFPTYSYMYCFALARLGNPQAIHTLKQFLVENMITEKAQNIHAESLSLQYGIAALKWIKPDAIQNFLPDKRTEFVKANVDYYHSFSFETPNLTESLQKHWDLEYANSTFRQWMEFAAEHFD